MKALFSFLLFNCISFASGCSPYFNPERFYDAPEYLQDIIKEYIQENKKLPQNKNFYINKRELYRYTSEDIATQVNELFGGFWQDWIEDGYEMQLIPEQTLFKYNKYYLSLEVIIEGVEGDATKLKGTSVKYKLYNYTPQVTKYIKCKGDEK